jgi:hypothetical protein
MGRPHNDITFTLNKTLMLNFRSIATHAPVSTEFWVLLLSGAGPRRLMESLLEAVGGSSVGM